MHLLNVQDVQEREARIQAFHMGKQPSSMTQATHSGAGFPTCLLDGQTVPTMEIVTITNLEWVFGCFTCDRILA